MSSPTSQGCGTQVISAYQLPYCSCILIINVQQCMCLYLHRKKQLRNALNWNNILLTGSVLHVLLPLQASTNSESTLLSDLLTMVLATLKIAKRASRLHNKT